MGKVTLLLPRVGRCPTVRRSGQCYTHNHCVLKTRACRSRKFHLQFYQQRERNKTENETHHVLVMHRAGDCGCFADLRAGGQD